MYFSWRSKTEKKSNKLRMRFALCLYMCMLLLHVCVCCFLPTTNLATTDKKHHTHTHKDTHSQEVRNAVGLIRRACMHVCVCICGCACMCLPGRSISINERVGDRKTRRRATNIPSRTPANCLGASRTRR